MGDRIIFHIDVNSAFLSWEAVRRLQNGDTADLRLIPSAVGGDEDSRHGVVLAKSRPAQAFGIQTGETLYSARRKCPELVVVPSDFTLYTQMSRGFFALLNDYSPVVEQLSIDEGFLEYTGLEKIYGHYEQAAYALKERIKSQLGFTVNIGIASNKILAKMAGELKKPDLVHTIFGDQLKTKLWPLPVRELYMVGAQSEKALVSHGINTIGDLAKAPPELVAAILKSHGMMIWKYANGIDNSPLVPTGLSDAKSYSNSTTLSRDALTLEENLLVLLKLCQSVCVRMRKDSLKCSTVTIQIKYSDFTVFSKQRHLKEATDSTDEIYSLVKQLFPLLWNKSPVRLLGLGLSDLSENVNAQISIFEDIDKRKHQKLDKVCDSIRMRFGNHAISFGSELEGDELGSLDRFFPEGAKKDGSTGKL